MRGAPETRVEAVTEVLHGVEVSDPYRWLEDAGSPEVRRWQAAQNAHTRRFLDGLPGRVAIEARLKEAVDVGALGPSVPRGRYRFLLRRNRGMEQPALHVVEADGRDRLLFDPAPLSQDAASAIDWWAPSADGEVVCLGVSEGGTENSTLMLLRTATGELLEERIPRCRWAAVGFEPGNGAVVYSRLPEPGSVPAGEELYHRHLWRHVLGSDPAGDVRIFGEGREKLDFPESVSFSDDGSWSLVVVAQGWDRTAVFLRERAGAFRPIFEGHASELHAWFAGGRLLGLTNFQAPNYRLVEIDPRRWQPEHWVDVVPESEHVLVDAAASADAVAAHHLVDACSRVTLFRPDGSGPGPVELPPFSSVTGLGAHPSSSRIFLTLQSFTRPASTLEVGAGEPEALASPPRFEAGRYPVRQARCRSRDGTEIPIFLIGRQGGHGPTVLTGYGGFNVSITPAWLPFMVPFWEAGGLLAVACLRGGGEYGERWHRAGMLGQKQNVFDDFAAAAEWLAGAGLATPERLGIVGGSNGGLLVGAAITQRPDLFGCAVCRVPLLDMIRYQRFKVAELWAAEYGSADDPEGFGWLRAYSPYHHVEKGVPYPPTLITTGEEDARVDGMHARKMAARLQAVAPGPVLLRSEPRAGHGQGKPASKQVPEETDVWSFMLHHLSKPADIRKA